MGLLGKKKKKGSGDQLEEQAGGVLSGLTSKAKAAKPGKRKLRDNERLASVIDESEPGSALSILEDNQKFALPGGIGFVILGLQTQSREFGGLSASTNKDQDKGMLVNLISTGAVNAIATPDLLDADILGLVMDEHSYPHISEFDSLLRSARYVYTVITVNPHTGSLVSFWVPAKNPESLQTGHLFDEAEKVLKADPENGPLITDVVDVDLVTAMLSILEAEEYGLDGLDEAMAVNQEVITEFMTDGRVPNGDDFLAELSTQFPEMLAGYDEAEAADDSEVDQTAVMPAVDEDAEATAVDADQDTEADSNEDEGDEPDFVEEPVAPASGGRHAADEADDDDEPDFTEEPVMGGGPDKDVDADDAADESETDAMGRHAADEINQAAGRGVVNTAEMDEETLIHLADLIAERTANQTAAIAGPAQESPEAVIADMEGPDDRVFTSGEVAAAAVRRYLNDDLGLVIDETSLQSNLRYEVPQLTLPEKLPVTEWLKDQLDVLVTGMNNELLHVWQNDYVDTRREFSEMMDSEYAAIREDLDPENRNGRFAEQVRLIKQDEVETREELPQYVQARQREVTESWAEDKKRWMDRETAELEARYERKFGPRRAQDLQRAHDNVVSMQEETIENQWAQLHRARRSEAASRAATSESVVLESMKPLVDVRRNRLEALRDKFSAQLRDYIDEHREEDLHQANVNREKLERDTRVQTILEDAKAQVAAADERAETEIARINAARERDRRSFQEELDRSAKNAESLSASAEADIAAARARADEAIADAEATKERIQAEAEERIAAIKENSEVTATTARNFIQNTKNNNTLLIFFVVLVVIIAAIASSFVTAAVLG